MSRLSRANLKARESIFAGGPEIYRGDIQAICPPNLAECVMAMEDCCEEAYEAQQLLRNGTYDLPRMQKVLENQRVFLLVDEGTVKKYKADLADEIEPSINELIEHAEKGLKALEKKESQLQAQVEAGRSRPLRLAVGATAAQKLETRRLQMLTKQRERLEQEVKELESEVEALELKVVNR
ncbi:Spc19-domain-containing protein [Collybia nuda]|uniref:DASH complex subunit SPC19 n=1 Tax=Collybia nuda TaxID=64659 RepID=A0A9P5Y4D9_9AGAR|nr:Spc19-domain-containing protein [Collybia nuda]